jgi:hydrogenase-4 component B
VSPLIIIALFLVPPAVAAFRVRLSYVLAAAVSALAFVISVISMNARPDTFYIDGLISFRFDALSSLFLMTAAVAWTASSIYSAGYDRNSRTNAIGYSVSILSMVVVLLSHSFFILLFGWEMMSIAGYLQIISRRDVNGRAPLLFIIFSELSSLLILLMTALLYAETGTFEMTYFTSTIAFLLGMFGFAVKMGITPFLISDWLPVAHGSAPTNGSVLFSATMTMLAVYCILRLISLTAAFLGAGILMMVAGAFTTLFASVFAATAEHVKIIPAYSTVENGGSMLIALGTVVVGLYYHDYLLAAFAAGTSIVFAFAHTLGKAGLFMFSGIVERRSRNGQLGSASGVSGVAAVAGGLSSAFSLAGLLPFGGGLGEWMLLETLFIFVTFGGTGVSVISVFVGAAVALGGGMSLVSMSKLIGYGTAGGRNGGSRLLSSGVAIAGSVVLVLGILSASFLYFSNGAVEIVTGHSISALIGGLLAVPDGFLITSPGPDGIFGLVSPLFIAGLIFITSATVYLLVGAGRRVRRVPVWSGGLRDEPGAYGPFQYSNPVRIMFRFLFGSGNAAVTPVNREWNFIETAGRAYACFSYHAGRRIMNSSIGRYMLYILAALIAVLVYVWI